jgi:membrane protease YdiL (CAAX protease family)
MASLFGAIHYPTYGAETVRDLDTSVVAGGIQTGIVGAVYGILYATTGTLLVPMLAHSVYDALLFIKMSGEKTDSADNVIDTKEPV